MNAVQKVWFFEDFWKNKNILKKVSKTGFFVPHFVIHGGV
jgi:hypothetical protein